MLWLEAAEHEATHFHNGESLIEALGHDSYDILILDWVLPGITGDKVLDWVRQNLGWDIPVIFITQNDSQSDIVAMLERGADDYMTKPVSQDELLARLTALGRRIKNPDKGAIVLDKKPYQLNLESHSLNREGENIPLTQKEFELAAYFFTHQGEILSRASILEKVWGQSVELNTRTVDIHVSRLRKKLGLTGDYGWRLVGIYNHGYRLEPTGS